MQNHGFSSSWSPAVNGESHPSQAMRPSQPPLGFPLESGFLPSRTFLNLKLVHPEFNCGTVKRFKIIFAAWLLAVPTVPHHKHLK
jgi:hypothetical protein